MADTARNINFLRAREMSKGQVIKGEYNGYQEKETKFGTSKLHYIGENEAIWGTATLNNALDGVERGDLIQITFNGKEATSQGGTRYLFDVAPLAEEK